MARLTHVDFFINNGIRKWGGEMRKSSWWSQTSAQLFLSYGSTIIKKDSPDGLIRSVWWIVFYERCKENKKSCADLFLGQHNSYFSFLHLWSLLTIHSPRSASCFFLLFSPAPVRYVFFISHTLLNSSSVFFARLY